MLPQKQNATIENEIYNQPHYCEFKILLKQFLGKSEIQAEM